MSTTTEQQSSVTSDKLEGHAASAAYIVTRDTSTTSKSSHPLLDEHGKLSTAGAATSLRQARAQDLPSFPSQGGVSLASAGAAASLAESNKKPFEYWKPGEIPAANKAAIQAQDYEMDPLWKPELSRAGSKAAVLAHRNTKSPDAIYTPFETQQGTSAAGVAQKNKYSPDAITSRDAPVSDQRKALMAATGAMAGSRRRADSAPIRPPNANANSKWALQAATSSHRAQTPTEFTTGDPGFEAARVQNMAKNKVNRQMYGSAPPVSIEVQEKNRQDMLKASAVAMARKMYAVQQAQIDEAKGQKGTDQVAGARKARGRSSSDAPNSLGSPPANYENLEEAARRLAQERLAKIHDEHAEYRQYYGAQGSPKQSRLTSLNLRKRRTRDSNLERDSDDDSDEEQSRRIRNQMSIFTSKLAEVDTKKRQADRDALLEAAHKNVTKQMNLMDEKVYKDTGKASPQQRELWERQARERAQRDSDDRMINVGRVHIGGGKYMDQSEVDAIAKARLQPTLDDITEKAEQQRAKDEAARLEALRVKQEAANEKLRQREIAQGVKENQRKEKDEETARKAEEKRIQKESAALTKERTRTEAAADKEKRQADKEAEREKARSAKEENQKDVKPGRFSSMFSKGGATAAGAAGVAGGATVAAADTAAAPENAGTEPATEGAEPAEPAERDEVEPADRASRESWEGSDRDEEKSPETPTSPDVERKEEPVSPPPVSPEEPTSPTSPTSPKGDKMKSWFRTRFRSMSKTQNDPEMAAAAANTTEVTETKDEDKPELPRSNSERDVAMAGRKSAETDDLYGDSNDAAPVSPVQYHDAVTVDRDQDRSPSISSLSDYAEEQAKSSPEQANKTSVEATPRMSIERPASETQESDGEPRGRPGFRQRLLSKVKRDKNKNKDKTIPEELTVEQQAASMPGAGPMPEPDAEVNDTSKPPATEDDADDEARDTFAEEKLAPPPALANATTSSPTRGSRERSKFTEDL